MNRFRNHYFYIVLVMLITKSESLVISDCKPQVEEKIGDYDVTCTEDSEGSIISIDCQNHHLANLTDVKFNLHFVSEIRFISCTFTRTANVQRLVQSLNVKYKTILFYNFGKNFNRLNFQNLSSPELFLMNSNISEISSDLFSDVLDIRGLIFTHTNLVSIPTKFFSVWAGNLLELSLCRNNLRKIATDNFADLINLVALNLAGNRIHEIESGAFDNLRYLQNLDLSSNQFYTLPSKIFHQLKALVNLNLSFYPRYHGQDDTDTEATDPKNLSMIQLENLAPHVFRGASNLRKISLEGHNLQNLPLGLFDDNKRLESLDLDSNKLTNLPVGIFKELKKLKYLYLSENRLDNLMPEVLMGLHSLEDVFASNNNLTKIEIQLIVQLKSLKYLHLAFNQITSIQQLEKKDLQNVFLPMNGSTNETLKLNVGQVMVMNLSFNSITEFNDDVFNFMANGQLIDLRYNKISKVNLSGLSSGRFDVDINREIQFMGVILSNNPLHCDCHLMGFVRYLNKSINNAGKNTLFINPIDKSNFSKEFKCSSPPELKSREVQKINLEEFNCLLQSNKQGDACNKICTCREYPGKRVLSVDCSHSHLKQLPAVVGNINNWSIELNMSGNSLKSTPSLKYSYLITVTKLDLSSNNITEVSLDTFSPALQELKLHNNSISRLNKTIIEYLVQENSLKSLSVHKNKWICDCETHKLLGSFNRKKISSYNFNKILCYGTNRTIYEVAESELCEDPKMLIIAASSLIAFFGIFMGFLAGLYYRYQQQIKIWLYSRQLFLCLITDDELDKDKMYDAFISFSHKDEHFVEKEIIGKLEEGPRPYKLCLHYRDWLAGEWIPLQISRSVADSRRTIIILTPNFLESVWGLVEFRTAHTQALKDGRSRLIVILHGEMGNIDDLDQELKDYLSLNTYIKWGDPWFWQKLKYALPHSLLNSRKVANFNSVSYRVTSNKNGGETNDGKVLRI